MKICVVCGEPVFDDDVTLEADGEVMHRWCADDDELDEAEAA